MSNYTLPTPVIKNKRGGLTYENKERCHLLTKHFRFLLLRKLCHCKNINTLLQYGSQSNHTRTTDLSNSMKPSHARRATQDGRVMVKRSDRMWSPGEGNGKPLQYSCLENPMNCMKRQTDRILKEELPRSVGAQYATGHQWRNNSRKNEGMEPKQKQNPAVDVIDDRSKVRCCKER